MLKLIKAILFAYGFVFSYLLFLSGIRNFRALSDLILVVVVSPLTFYFLLSVMKQFRLLQLDRNKIETTLKHLKVVALVNSLFLFVIALYGSIFRFEFMFILMIIPIPVYFILLNFVKEKKTKIIVEKQEEKQIKKTKTKAVLLKEPFGLKSVGKIKGEMIGEPLRRTFIKALGGAGIGFLIVSLINPKKAEASFFGSVPGPGTIALKDSNNVKIDPAIKSPTDAYGISQIADTVPAYYGFVNKDGAWYITREEDDGSYRYAKGILDFAGNWGNRGGLTYGYFNSAFSS